MAQSGSEFSGLSSIDEEPGDESGDEPSLRPEPVPAARTPVPQPKSQSPEKSESIEFNSGDISGSRPQSRNGTDEKPAQGSRPQSRNGMGGKPAQQDESPATIGFSSFAGLESSDLGDKTTHSRNLGSSAESGQQAPPHMKEDLATHAPGRPPTSPGPSSGQTSPSAQFSGRTSPAPYSSQHDEVSYGGSGFSTPRRSQSPAGAAADAAMSKHQEEGGPPNRWRGSKGDDVEPKPRSSGGSQHSHKQQEGTQSVHQLDPTAQPANQEEQSQDHHHHQQQQQQQQQQHKKGVAITTLEAPSSMDLASGPHPAAIDSPRAESRKNCLPCDDSQP
ncbi:hypothetical protein DUNSADRAFT_5709 [Dunaliella salina]|uniref:Encoded protein n=1 Tax=Dunaliella salina TaxID=3046 RepID=A0ABQ7GPR1_DUNSA|nr:hypothetical protein DUNSADRAFT_5709 [Dunaliella salina]|eukprot:KAF5836592.1 hypothetical protein DUNSADRAFT_5709 [Dunaliella salina]